MLRLCCSWLAVSTCRCYVVVGWPDMDAERQAWGRDRCCYVVVGRPDMDIERQARGRDRCCYVVVGRPCLHVEVML